MPISLTALKERTAQVDVFDELNKAGRRHTGMKANDLTVTYRVLTGSSLDESVRKITEDEAAGEDPETQARRQRQNLATLLVENLVAWDLSAAPDEPPIPLEVDAVAAVVPIDLMTDIFEAIGLHKRPNRKERRA